MYNNIGSNLFFNGCRVNLFVRRLYVFLSVFLFVNHFFV